MRKNLPMIFIRVMVGVVFVTEGILKFVLPGELGSGRFAHIGFPYPHLLAPFVGGVEIAAGAALTLNLYTGDAAVLLLAVTVTALITTKVPILLGHSLGRFAPAQADTLRAAELLARSTHGFVHAAWLHGDSHRRWSQIGRGKPR